MEKILNAKSLYLIPILFLLIILFRAYFSYADMKAKEYDFAKQEAQALDALSIAHRNYYQKLFLDKKIKLDDSTLVALPAYSSYYISNEFSKNNSFKISIRTVSDRARNRLNRAEYDDLAVINFFKKHKDIDIYFSDKNKKFYHYASALRIKKGCLKCHSTPQKAPKVIREKYITAYGYKLGDVRGIMSVKIPKETIDRYFFKYFRSSLIMEMGIFIALFVIIYFIISRIKAFNSILESEVQSKTKAINELLLVDTLTGLPNRRKFIQDMNKYKMLSSRHLAIINIDRFKDINDFYGNDLADELLKKVAYHLQTMKHFKTHIVYRLTGDEYAIFCLSGILEYEFVEKIRVLVDEIESNIYTIYDNDLSIGLGCGTASNVEDIVKKADMALKVSKYTNKSITTYSPDIDTSKQVAKNIESVKFLKDAIANNDVVPFYQPIYSIKESKITKHECLVRIVKGSKVVSPYEFLDIAVKSKLYPNITKIMIEKAFAYFKDKDYEFSINLSLDDMTNPSTTEFIIDKLRHYANSQNVVFEILENDKLGNYKSAKEFIAKAKFFGVKVAIDDFGSGYSNFAHILKLDIDYLKIDASIVKNIKSDNISRKIVATIVRFASGLNIQTIAEYIEDQESVDILRDLGVDFLQGYFISKPLPEI